MDGCRADQIQIVGIVPDHGDGHVCLRSRLMDCSKECSREGIAEFFRKDRLHIITFDAVCPDMVGDGSASAVHRKFPERSFP